MKSYLALSGLIFAFVAVLHGVRLVQSTPMQVGTATLPLWVSALVTVGGIVMAVWAFSLRRP